MNRSKKGDRRERELVNELNRRGFAVMRAPASGAATDRELPDVHVGNGSVSLAIEAKSSSGQPIYIDKQEVYDLLFFSRRFGSKPRIGARFNKEDWAFFHPAELYTTNSGNFRVKKKKAVQDGEAMKELVKTPQLHTPELQNRLERLMS